MRETWVAKVPADRGWFTGLPCKESFGGSNPSAGLPGWGSSLSFHLVMVKTRVLNPAPGCGK